MANARSSLKILSRKQIKKGDFRQNFRGNGIFGRFSSTFLRKQKS
jgi:hypothetical protein